MKELGVRRSACQDLMTKGTSDEVVLAWRQKDCDFLSSRAENGREVVPYQYRYLGYAAMVQRMQYLQLIYPEYISLYAAQAKYNLPVVGTCSEDTRGILKAGCKAFVLELGKKGTANAETRPQLFFSGALHGNERVGPTALVELATYMLGRMHQDPWLRRMLEERTIVLMPAANAIGYFGNTREEAGTECSAFFARNAVLASGMLRTEIILLCVWCELVGTDAGPQSSIRTGTLHTTRSRTPACEPSQREPSMK
eukprot:3571353-Rhodomonas_salina.1